AATPVISGSAASPVGSGLDSDTVVSPASDQIAVVDPWTQRASGALSPLLASTRARVGRTRDSRSSWMLAGVGRTSTRRPARFTTAVLRGSPSSSADHGPTLTPSHRDWR